MNKQNCSFLCLLATFLFLQFIPYPITQTTFELFIISHFSTFSKYSSNFFKYSPIFLFLLLFSLLFSRKCSFQEGSLDAHPIYWLFCQFLISFSAALSFTSSLPFFGGCSAPDSFCVHEFLVFGLHTTIRYLEYFLTII